MKIGIDARILQNQLRGQGQYAYYLIANLLKIDTVNEYILFYNGLMGGKFAFSGSIPNLRQIWCHVPGRLLRPLWDKISFPRAEHLLGKIDVFHNTINFNFTHYTPIPANAPMVATFHGMADPRTIWQQYDQKQLDGWFNKIAVQARFVIVVSDSVRDDLLKRVSIPQERVKVIHCGVSDDFKPVMDRGILDPVLEKYGLMNKRYLLYVGAAEENKNLARLVDAFGMICNRPGMEDVWLALVGNKDGDYIRLEKKITLAGLSGRVFCPGYISHQDLPCIYSGAAAFVLPTLHEWFGIPLVEAMKCGIPVAASNTRGVPEVVGDAAVLFNPADTADMAQALETVLSSEGIRQSLNRRGIQRAGLFSWDKAARKTLQVYTEAALR
jgi:glycosyltransferase involved in cell wall biosynthesis